MYTRHLSIPDNFLFIPISIIVFQEAMSPLLTFMDLYSEVQLITSLDFI